MKQYGWKPGRHYSTSPQQFGEWVESLPDRRPETIVRHARDPKSPGYKEIWKAEDAVAANEWRLLQARLMLASLVVDVIIYERKKKKTIQAQAIVHSSRDGEYDYIDVAMSDPDKRNFVLAQAMAQLQAMKRRYASLSDLAVVFAAVDQVAKRIRKRHRAG
jgi:hypothetical protein